VNNICRCGHKKEEHRYWGSSCCWVKNKKGFLICECREYKPDNLIFLEEIVYQKGFEQYSANKKYQAKKVN